MEATMTCPLCNNIGTNRCGTRGKQRCCHGNEDIYVQLCRLKYNYMLSPYYNRADPCEKGT